MPMVRARQPETLPLLVWHEQAEVDRLQRERDGLKARINALKPFAHKRLELEYRLKVLTARQLALQTEMTRRAAR